MEGTPRELGAYIQKQRSLIDSAIDAYARTPDETKLSKATSYALYPGEGHRYRGLIALEVYRLLGGNEEGFLPSVVGIECIHFSSLIFDDLPCMDNAPFRRGKPTTHQQFGENTAILAGLYLLVQGQDLITQNSYDHCQNLKEMQKVEQLVYHTLYDLIAGQALDLQRGKGNEELLRSVAQKNRLFHLACVLPAYLLKKAEHDSLSVIEKNLAEIGTNLAIAYQFFDDLRDVEGDTTVTGKPTGMDKETFVHRWGIAAIKEELSRKREDALVKVRLLEGHSRLEELIQYILTTPS